MTRPCDCRISMP